MTEAIHIRQLLLTHPAPWRVAEDGVLPQCEIFDARGQRLNTFEDNGDERTFWIGIVSAINLLHTLAPVSLAGQRRKKAGADR